MVFPPGKNRDVWELTRLLFTPAVCQVLRLSQKRGPPRRRRVLQTKAAATYKDHRLQKKENPYKEPRPAQLQLTAAQQDTLRAVNEKIEQKAQLTKRIKEEALQAQQNETSSISNL